RLDVAAERSVACTRRISLARSAGAEDHERVVRTLRNKSRPRANGGRARSTMGARSPPPASARAPGSVTVRHIHVLVHVRRQVLAIVLPGALRRVAEELRLRPVGPDRCYPAPPPEAKSPQIETAHS